VGLPGGQDEHLAGIQFAHGAAGSERDSALEAVDRDLTGAWWVGIAWPLARISRRTSSVAVFANVLDGAPGGAGPG